MRYYLHVRHCDDMLSDCEGSEHPHLDDARLEAVEAARQMISQAALGGWDVSDRCFEICDEGGTVLTRVPFGATLRRSMLIGDVGKARGSRSMLPNVVATALTF